MNFLRRTAADAQAIPAAISAPAASSLSRPGGLEETRKPTEILTCCRAVLWRKRSPMRRRLKRQCPVQLPH